MRTAWLNLRYTLPERQAAFTRGLESLGFKVRTGFPVEVKTGDIFCTWNRIGPGDFYARQFEGAGNAVLVAENAAWGNEFCGARWYSLARGRHNTAGMFPVGGSERWASLDVHLTAWRVSGETVVLPQRGIGSAPTAMPRGWADQQGGRIRRHPGQHEAMPLEADLKDCANVVTWGSGAAIKALMMGIKVESHMPNWIGQQDNTDEGRLAMFRRLAWAQWTVDEIATGEPFRRLL